MNDELLKELFSVLSIALLRAKEKHPYFPFDKQKAAALIAEEHLELLQEINDRAEDGKKDNRIFEESLDLAVAVCRFLMRQIAERTEK